MGLLLLFVLGRMRGGLWAKDQPFPLSVLWDIDTPFLIALSE